MSPPHRIRIRGPWKYRLPSGQTGTTTLPAKWEGRAPELTLSRHFNWPAKLEPNERVFLVFAGYGGHGAVDVNESEVGRLDGHSSSFDITRLLRPGNELQIRLSFATLGQDEPRGLWGDVLLEVRTDPEADRAGTDNK